VKRLLLITYYWPPAGGAGVLRWLRFCRLLPEFGWQPTVVTTSGGDYPLLDPTLEEPDVRVVRAKTPTYGALWRMVAGRKAALPYGSLTTARTDPPLKKLAYWLRTNVIIPDARVLWAPWAARAAAEELRSARYDAVVTTGPPHSVHLAGLKLKRRYGRPWLADFRDPWSRISWLTLGRPCTFTRRAHESLERRVFAASNAQTVFSPYFIDLFPAGDKHVLFNGYDEREYEGLAHTRGEKFRVKYVGRITAGRDITPLLDALADEDMPELEVSLGGCFETLPEEYTHRRPRLCLRNVPFGPHRAALEETVNAEVAVLLTERYADGSGIIPLKLFEYVGARTWTLGLGDPTGASAALLHAHSAGRMVACEDADGIRQAVRERYALWKAGAADRLTGDVSALSAREQTRRLAALLDGMVQASGRSIFSRESSS